MTTKGTFKIEIKNAEEELIEAGSLRCGEAMLAEDGTLFLCLDGSSYYALIYFDANGSSGAAAHKSLMARARGQRVNVTITVTPV